MHALLVDLHHLRYGGCVQHAASELSKCPSIALHFARGRDCISWQSCGTPCLYFVAISSSVNKGLIGASGRAVARFVSLHVTLAEMAAKFDIVVFSAFCKQHISLEGLQLSADAFQHQEVNGDDRIGSTYAESETFLPTECENSSTIRKLLARTRESAGSWTHSH
jgi:hypothetical protein